MIALMQRRSGAYIVLFLGTLLAFHNSFDNSFHYDDEHSILENPHIRTLKNMPAFFVDPGKFSGMLEARMYRPLLMVTFAVNYAVGEYGVFGYHVVNFLLHLINAWLLWEVGALLLGNRGGALWAALLFVAHPCDERIGQLYQQSFLAAVHGILPGGLPAGIAGMRRGWRGATRRCWPSSTWLRF